MSALIIGIPRSGTSWTLRVLGAATGVAKVNEPDNETIMPYPVRAKRALGRFPLLAPGTRAPAYERLWAEAFSGRYPRRTELARRAQQRWNVCVPTAATPLRIRPARGPVVVKSVLAPLCADWLCECFSPRVLVVLRDPVEVAASWLALHDDGYRFEYAGDPQRLLSADALAALGTPPRERADAVVWLVGALWSQLRDFAERSGAAVLRHEKACAAPRAQMQRAAEAIGLPWDARSDAALAAANQPGSGWAIERVAASVPGAWRRRLDPPRVARIEALLAQFAIAENGHHA